jgi:hypothetical protein
MTNLLEETTRVIYASGHTLVDIVFIGAESTGHQCTWIEFMGLADVEYDEGFGLQNVACDLVIVFNSGASLVRHDYDGQESWRLIKPFRMPTEVRPIKTLIRASDDKQAYARTLEDLNP